MAHETEEVTHLDLHVAVCAERYKALEQRLDRIERIVWWSSSMLMTGMGGMILKLMMMK